jgi:hypothetical protein
VAVSVAGVIEPTFQAAETARSAGLPTSDLTAYDLYLRAYAMVLSSEARFPEALHLMEQAIDCDPSYGPALLGPRSATCGRTTGAPEKRSLERAQCAEERSLGAASHEKR